MALLNHVKINRVILYISMLKVLECIATLRSNLGMLKNIYSSELKRSNFNWTNYSFMTIDL